jgi:PPOX class probable F420-dependent enzyme
MTHPFLSSLTAQRRTLLRDWPASAFAVDGDVVYSAVDSKPKRRTALKRLANVAANPAVALLVDHYADDWDELWWVRADGTGRVVDPEDPEGVRALSLLADRYPRFEARGRCSPSMYAAGRAGPRRRRPTKTELVLLPVDGGPQIPAYRPVWFTDLRRAICLS